MKNNDSGKRGPQDPAQQHAQPDKVGWIRKFCGKGVFREIWKNRFVVLKADQLFICQKELVQRTRMCSRRHSNAVRGRHQFDSRGTFVFDV